MKPNNSKKKTTITTNGVLPEVKMRKNKRQKEEYVTIEVRVGSIVIVPKEIEAFKKHGIDLLAALKTIQQEIYKKPKIN